MNFSISDSSQILVPPCNVSGMKKLDRDAFKKTISVPSLKIPVKNLQPIFSFINKHLLKVRNLTAIKDIPDDETCKEIILNPETIKCWDDLSETTRENLSNLQVDKTDLTWRSLELSYENWNYEDIIKAVLVGDGLIFAGFSIIGHIIHLNLREELLPYKHIIGEVLLDKKANISLVVNKTSIIENEFRSFSMEVLAGNGSTVTTAKENGLTYSLDFAKVYWNQRLSTEHERIVNMVKSGDVLFDVFAGIGPFALPAGKKKCKAFANDLNPDSYFWLKKNVQDNKVQNYVETYNLDGRDFVKQCVREKLMEIWKMKEGLVPNVHVVMNLPALAIDFLDAFRGLCSDYEGETTSLILPNVHVYAFVKYSLSNSSNDTNEPVVTEENYKQHLLQRIRDKLDPEMGLSDIHVRFVRKVAPSKDMFRISFTLSTRVLLGKSLKRSATENNNVVNIKKHCIDGDVGAA